MSVVTRGGCGAGGNGGMTMSRMRHMRQAKAGRTQARRHGGMYSFFGAEPPTARSSEAGAVARVGNAQPQAAAVAVAAGGGGGAEAAVAMERPVATRQMLKSTDAATEGSACGAAAGVAAGVEGGAPAEDCTQQSLFHRNSGCSCQLKFIAADRLQGVSFASRTVRRTTNLVTGRAPRAFTSSFHRLLARPSLSR